MDVSSQPEPAGRVAKTRGVSLQPAEREDLKTVEELTGAGFSEVYRRHFAPQVHAAAQLLLEMQQAGVELDRTKLRTEWDLTRPSDLGGLYAAESELSFGD
ncbi:MAG: hypothetical protein ACR2HR_01145 [Euzebya sp.]